MTNLRDDMQSTALGKLSTEVWVDTFNFDELTTKFAPLMLDTYQRPYVWGENNVIQLLQDFRDFSTPAPSDDRQYYLGTVLLHEKAESSKIQYCVIDGQQRLTTLAILYWLLRNSLPNGIEFTFRSVRSLASVQQTKKTMLSWLEAHPECKLLFTNLWVHLRFTVIRVASEDLAFTFFDTQNNRGVPLGSTDLLKAFHLRAIKHHKQEQVEQLQSHCARKWEQVQQCGELVKKNKNHDFAPNLFHYYLWRARNWRGSDVQELESRDEMLSHFGAQSLPTEIGKVVLYPGGSNVWGEALVLTEANDFQLTPVMQHVSSNAAHLPFSLRQPISRGVGFFLFTEKYAHMLQDILFSKSIDIEIRATQHFYKTVVSTLSEYLQSLFQLALLVYVDRLGSKGLLRFSLYLDHRLGALRLSQADIRRETPLKFLRDAKQNLLDVIAQAYVGEEVVRFLQVVSVDNIYSQNSGWQEAINGGSSKVQERYAKAVADYYSLTQLAGKTSDFIDAKVIEVLKISPRLGNEQYARRALHG